MSAKLYKFKCPEKSTAPYHPIIHIKQSDLRIKQYEEQCHLPVRTRFGLLATASSVAAICFTSRTAPPKSALLISSTPSLLMGRSAIAVMQIGAVWCWAGGKSEAAVIATASVT